jgi:hypothetical protein
MALSCEFLELKDIGELVSVLNEVRMQKLDRQFSFIIGTNTEVQFRLKQKYLAEKANKTPITFNAKGKSLQAQIKQLFKLVPEADYFVYTKGNLVAPVVDESLIKENVKLLKKDYNLLFGDESNVFFYDRVLMEWERETPITMPVPLLSKLLQQIENTNCVLTTWFNFGLQPTPLINFDAFIQTEGDENQLSMYSDVNRVTTSGYSQNLLPAFNLEAVPKGWQKCWLLLRLHMQSLLISKTKEAEAKEVEVMENEEYFSAEEAPSEVAALGAPSEVAALGAPVPPVVAPRVEGEEESKEELPKLSISQLPTRSLRYRQVITNISKVPKPTVKLTLIEKENIKKQEQAKKLFEKELTAFYRDFSNKKIFFQHRLKEKAPVDFEKYVTVAYIYNLKRDENYDIIFDFKNDNSLVTVIESLKEQKKSIYVVCIKNEFHDVNKYDVNKVFQTLNTFLPPRKFDHLIFHGPIDAELIPFFNPISTDDLIEGLESKEVESSEENTISKYLFEKGSIIFHFSSFYVSGWKSLSNTVDVSDILKNTLFFKTFSMYYFYYDFYSYFKNSFIQAENLDYNFPPKKKIKRPLEYAESTLTNVYTLLYENPLFYCEFQNGKRIQEAFYPLNVVADENWCNDLQKEVKKNWDPAAKFFNEFKTLENQDYVFVTRHVKQGKSALFLCLNELFKLKGDFGNLIDENALFGNKGKTLKNFMDKNLNIVINQLQLQYRSLEPILWNLWCIALVQFFRNVAITVIDISESAHKVVVFKVENIDTFNMFFILKRNEEFFPFLPVYSLEKIDSSVTEHIKDMFKENFDVEEIPVPTSIYTED